MIRTVFSQLKITYVGGNLGTANGKYSSGVLAPNGKIYYAPYSETRILEFNPETLTTQYVGPILTNGALQKYHGGVLAPNGKIYFAPTLAPKILEFNPETLTAQFVGNDLGEGTAKYVGGVLAPNGKIYYIPYIATRVLEFNPQTLTSQYVGDAVFNQANSGYTGVLGADGNIYLCPSGLNKVVRFNPNNYSITHIGTDLGTDLDKYAGCILASNNKIYFTPRNKKRILELNTETSTTQEVGPSFLTGGGISGNFHGVAQSPNGRLIYPQIYLQLKAFEFNPSDLSGGFIGPAVNGNFAKFTSATLAPNGKIYFCPWYSPRILEITPSNLMLPDPTDLVIPELSLLAQSNYNRYFNKY